MALLRPPPALPGHKGPILQGDVTLPRSAQHGRPGGSAASAGRLAPSNSRPPSPALQPNPTWRIDRTLGDNRGGQTGGPCPAALPASRCRSGCGWRGPGRRAAGRRRRWSRCSRRSQRRRPCCGERGDPRSAGRDTLAPTRALRPGGQGGCGDTGWAGDAPQSIPLSGDPPSTPCMAEPKQTGWGQHHDGDRLPAGGHPALPHGLDAARLPLLLPNPERRRAQGPGKAD